MSVNLVRANREKELLKKGKYYNPFQLQNEIELNIQKKHEVSQENKVLKEQFLNSMKNDINYVYQKKDDEVNL